MSSRIHAFSDQDVDLMSAALSVLWYDHKARRPEITAFLEEHTSFGIYVEDGSDVTAE